MSSDSLASPMAPQTLLDRLAPDYRVFVEAQPPNARIALHTLQWDPALRQPFQFGRASPVPVGSTRTIQLGRFSVFVLTPDGEQPTEGWPVYLHIHGGGWMLGSPELGISLCSRVCVEAKCVVVSVDYRLAPENPFPAAVEDCWEALLWLRGAGKDELGIDISRIAVGGESAGGNLSAVIAQRAALASPRIPLVLQILNIPSTDLTPKASDKSQWTPSMVEYQNIFGICAFDILWFRDHYVPKVEDRTNPEASPLLQNEKKAYEGMPQALVLVTELDPLKSEGELYAEKMRENGVAVTLKEYKGIPHLGVYADGVCTVAQKLRDDYIEALVSAFAR
ncbi:lipase from carbohydrate esterase family CE10 protein [Ceratobasidium theobromae]|uniref:Lipase from carbohydrate esterase family CE10 protein n=1 Tax=Ceratobasidium theobromae TaxID=1582974 RepID=A0A5N5QK74_9AGAM|nr:lipase from carbohydrate esterase family CE10 protein [Ceratobasidium theobromae]